MRFILKSALTVALLLMLGTVLPPQHNAMSYRCYVAALWYRQHTVFICDGEPRWGREP